MHQQASETLADVTVIMPAYNAAATIGRALTSVAAQTLRPRAVVVVDDGSQDDTQACAETYSDLLAPTALTVIRQGNAGAGAARNRALAVADSTYVAFLDADDEWLPEKLARSMDLLAKTGSILVAHDSLEVHGDETRRLDCARRFADSKDAPLVGLYRRGYIDTSTVVARRDAIETAGGFDTTLPNGQDFELWLAILGNPGTPFAVFDEALSRYHITPDSIMSHIERRRACCMIIARRYAPVLRNHPGSALASLWFRTVAVHYEAVTAHHAKGDWLAGAIALARLPGNLITVTIGHFVGRVPARRPPPR